MFNIFKIKRSLLFSLMVIISSPSLYAHEVNREDSKVTPVMKKILNDYPGKEALMVTVIYNPGEVGIPHRHDAHVFVYVLEGSVIMGLEGSNEVTLQPGDSFYEGPEDIHTVARNPSKTNPAKLLVLLLKNEGEPVVKPLN
jgi:quercetin dioxygenase-like cupin family protein